MLTYSLSSVIGLPNLHPLVVHFPIALAPVAALFDVALLARPRFAWLDRGAATLYALAAIGAAAAVRAGEAAAESLGPLDPAAREILHEHERLATWSLWILVGLAAVRGVTAWRDRRLVAIPRTITRLVLLAAGIAAVTFVAGAADHGGRLVYQHGVAIAPPVDPALR